MDWTSEPNENVKSILHFWFEDVGVARWYDKDPILDATIRKRFYVLLEAAARCELYEWRNTHAGRLAEIILLDQFSRNIFRGQAQAFSQDALALALAQEAVARGSDLAVGADHRHFFYMPYMHSESAKIHMQAETLFREQDPSGLQWELRHKAIIDRFGRYPHRNALLGRTSTQEELEFLKQPGSSF